MNDSIKTLLTVIGTLSFSLNTFAQSEGPREEYQNSRDEFYRMVEQGMPEVITEDNSTLVEALLSPRLGKPFAQTFDRDRAVKMLFDDPPQFDNSCHDRESDRCGITAGKAEGTGRYSKLAIEHNGVVSNVRFAHREDQSTSIARTSLSDAKAYQYATDLLVNLLGVPKEEIPVAPRNAKIPLPVKTVNLAYSNGKTDKAIPVEKLIKTQRGLYIPGDLGWVPGPGKIVVSVNDSGVSSLAVRNWADMSRYGKDLEPRNAKSRSDLVEELVTRFEREGLGHLHSARSLVAISLPRGAESPIPVLRVFASAQPRDMDEKAQANTLSTAGVVLEIPLIAQGDDYSSQQESE